MVRLQLKSATTVGQILDIMKFSVKMLVVEKGGGGEAEEGICVTTDDVILLKEIFQLMPENFSQDPVKVRGRLKAYKLFLYSLITIFAYELKNKTVFNLNNKRLNVHK